MQPTTRVRPTYEWAMVILALAIVPVLILEDRTTDPTLLATAVVLNWIIWLAFTVEFVVGFSRSTAKLAYVRQSWFDLLIIVLSPPIVPQALQGTRTLRVLRLLRLLRGAAVLSIGLRSARRAFGKRKFHYVALFALAVVTLGAMGVYLVERGRNPNIDSVADAAWWAVVTATTVGYGDVSPTTTEGRLIAVLLMLTGIGIIGVFTATLASFFLEQEVDTPDLEVRLQRLEEKLDALTTLLSRK